MQRRCIQLAAPFSAIGLVGGALTGSITGRAAFTLAFALVTAITAAIWGAWLTREMRKESGATNGFFVFGTVAAGVFNGAVILIPAVFPLGSVAGGIVGAFFSLLFLPPLAVVMVLAKRRGRAREGSLVDAVDRRSPYIATALMIAATTLVAFHQRWELEARNVFTFGALLCALAAALFFTADLVALFRARRAERLLPCYLDRGVAPRLGGGDFGVGPDVMLAERPGATPYRHVHPSIRLFGGDPRLAYVLLRADVIRNGVIVAVVTIIAIAHVLSGGAAIHRNAIHIERDDWGAVTHWW